MQSKCANPLSCCRLPCTRASQDIDKTKEELEGILELFRDFVQRNRPKLDVAKVATGEVWFGPQALALGLCDELATTDDVLLRLVQGGHQVRGPSNNRVRAATEANSRAPQ
jgi:serine protease SohB